jgi:TIR domain/NACHT domain
MSRPRNINANTPLISVCYGHTGRVSEEMTSAFAAAVIRLAVRLWSRDEFPLGDPFPALIDRIENQVSGSLQQRQVRRYFDNLEDILAHRIDVTFSAEFRSLGRNELYSALLFAAASLDRIQLTDAALFAPDLDPLTLEGSVRRHEGQGRLYLSAVATVVYNRLLALGCAFVIEIVPQFPRFRTGAFAELLRRDAQILTRLEEVLERLPEPGDDSRKEHFETAYRQHIAKRLDRLEIFGLDFAAPLSALGTAYVNLTLSGGARAANVRRTFDIWLADHPRLLIEGSLGSGKTTLLQWAAVRAALRDFADPVASLNGKIPFFLHLRAYADQELPTPDEFLASTAPMLATAAPAGWVHEQFRSGRALLLVDGADEVPDHQRLEVALWLRDLTLVYPGARYVVTARPGALDMEASGDAGFIKATVDPMDPALSRVFIDRWYGALQWWQKDADTVDALANYCDSLLKMVDSSRFIRELASTPLLAGLVCALNEHAAGQLPQRRSEILDAVLGMFGKRDHIRGVGNSDLDRAKSEHLLGDLALWMLRNGTTAADSATARQVLNRSGNMLVDRPDVDADLYGAALRSGLLRESAADQVTFLHRIFQEYLAAKALIQNDSIGEIVRNANDDQWYEVVILASGQGNPRQTNEILSGLLPRQRTGSAQYQRRLTAVACLGEILAADPEVIRRLEDAIPELLPPRSLEEAEALSSGGDRMIPYLARTLKVADVSQLPPVVRAASLIGGSDALDLIAAVAQMSRISAGPAAVPALRDELARAAQYFDTGAYEEKVLIPLGIRLRSRSQVGRRVVQAQDPASKKFAHAAARSRDAYEAITGHVFISYVREDTAKVAQLEVLLEEARIPLWRDTEDILPGDNWPAQVRRAITKDALAFVACFSHNSLARTQTWQNEEIALAVNQLRLRSPDIPWLIPVRLDDCAIPDLDIGYGRTLTHLHHADLFDVHYERGARQLITAIELILGRRSR